jgi:hypothetical protein
MVPSSPNLAAAPAAAITQMVMPPWLKMLLLVLPPQLCPCLRTWPLMITVLLMAMTMMRQ